MGYPGGSEMVKNLPAMQETRVRSLHQEDLLEKGMAIHSSILAWKIPDTGAWQATIHGVSKSRTQLSGWAYTQWLNKTLIPLELEKKERVKTFFFPLALKPSKKPPDISSLCIRLKLDGGESLLVKWTFLLSHFLFILLISQQVLNIKKYNDMP